MSREIPDTRFRLSHTFAIQPELVCDEGPAKSVLIGQNAPASNAEAVYIGKHAETPHRSVWMDVRGAHVLYVMGKRRSGKSYTLGVVAESLISDSWVRQGDTKQGVLILDTMNVFLTMPFTVENTYATTSVSLKDMKKWKIESEKLPLTLFAPAGTEMPGDLSAERINLRASDLGPEEWCGLFEVDPFVDPLGHLITTLHSKISSEGVVDQETGRRSPPRQEFGLSDLLDALDRDRDLNDFQRETREALGRRLKALERLPLFGMPGLDVRQLVRPGEISVLLLRDIDTELRAVLVALIVKRIMQLRAISEQQERVIPIHLARAEKLEHSDTEKANAERSKAEECAEKAKEGLPRCWLIIDEAHNYVPAKSTVPSRKPLKKYVDEGRNLGLSILVATQQPSGLDPSLQRNADILLIHSLSHHDDILAALGMINTAVPEDIALDGKYRITGPKSFEALVRSLPLGYAIAATDRANRLFPLCIRPRITVHGGSDY